MVIILDYMKTNKMIKGQNSINNNQMDIISQSNTEEWTQINYVSPRRNREYHNKHLIIWLYEQNFKIETTGYTKRFHSIIFQWIKLMITKQLVVS